MEQFEKDPLEEFLDKIEAEYRALPFYAKIIFLMQEQMFLTLFLSTGLGFLLGYLVAKTTGFGW